MAVIQCGAGVAVPSTDVDARYHRASLGSVPTRPGKARRAGRTWVGAAAGLLAVVGLGARFISTTVPALIDLAAFAPVLMAGAVVAVIAFWFARLRALTGIALVLTVVIATTQAPLFLVDARADAVTAVPLVVLQANLMVGHTDAAAVVALVRDNHVDVLTIDELTQSQLDRLVIAGLERYLPYEAALPAGAAAGTGVWTKRAMTGVSVLAASTFHSIIVRTTTSAGDPVTVVAAHPRPPINGRAGVWNSELQTLDLQLEARIQETDDPIIVGADFNATWDMVQFRSFLGGGFSDAAELAGAGITATYPTDKKVFGVTMPPILAIDHVLVHGADVSSVRVVDLPGSDHRGLLVRVLVPTGAVAIRVGS
jgi:endonuclease/exonuclease/phosphatase (EEP) superfamily protein YafD